MNDVLLWPNAPKKHISTKAYPFLGDTEIYLPHNKYMGRCRFIKDGKQIIIPNMPKLQYAADLSLFFHTQEIQIRPELLGKIAYVFEKVDGFNLLFWHMPYKREILTFPKTRMKPYPHGAAVRIISSPEFPLKKIKQFIREQDAIPVFEVWGHALTKAGLIHGPVVYDEETPELEVVLIGILNKHTFEFVHPDVLITAAEKYGFEYKLLDRIKINKESVRRWMEKIDNVNHTAGRIKMEGVVFHTIMNDHIELFKVKPLNIMKRDLYRGLDEERVLKEYTKIKLEYSPIEIARNFDDIVASVIQFIEEDVKIHNREKKRIAQLIAERVARELYDSGIRTPEQAGRAGVKGIVIAHLKQI